MNGASTSHRPTTALIQLSVRSELKSVARAAQTIRNMRWFEVVETRGTIKDGKIEYWQVTIKVGFTLDEDTDM